MKQTEITKARASPCSWHVLSNTGTVVTAINNVSGENFNGTPAAFNAMIKRPLKEEATAHWNMDRTAFVHPETGDSYPLGALGQFKNPRKPGLLRLALWDKVSNVGGTGAAKCTDDATLTPLVGSSAVRFQASAAGTYNFSSLAVRAAVDMTNGAIHFTYKKPTVNGVAFNLSSLSTVRIELHYEGTPAAPSANFISASIAGDIKARGKIYDTWQCYSISTADITTLNGTATLANKSAITHVIVTLIYTSASQNVVYFGALDYVPNAKNKATLVLTFDDSLRDGVIDYVLPILAKYNIPAVIFADPLLYKDTQTGIAYAKNNTALLSLKELKQLQAHGWQIASQRHSFEGDYPMSLDEFFAFNACNMRDRQRLGLFGGEDGSFYGGVYSNVTSDSIEMCKGLYRTMSEYIFNPLSISETLPFGDPYSLRRQGFNQFGNNTAANVGTNTMLAVTRGVNTKGLIEFGFHDEFTLKGNSNNQAMVDANKAAFEAIIAYVVANPTLIEVCTLAELEKYNSIN